MKIINIILKIYKKIKLYLYDNTLKDHILAAIYYRDSACSTYTFIFEDIQQIMSINHTELYKILIDLYKKNYIVIKSCNWDTINTFDVFNVEKDNAILELS